MADDVQHGRDFLLGALGRVFGEPARRQMVGGDAVAPLAVNFHGQA